MRERHRTPAAQENVQDLKRKSGHPRRTALCLSPLRGWLRVCAWVPVLHHGLVGQVVITSNFRTSSMNFGMSCWRPVLLSDTRHPPSVAVCLVLPRIACEELAMVILSSAARDGCVQEGASERSPHERQLRRLEGLLWLQWSPLAQQTVRLTPCARTCSFPPLESKRVSHEAQKAGRAVATLDGGIEAGAPAPSPSANGRSSGRSSSQRDAPAPPKLMSVCVLHPSDHIHVERPSALELPLATPFQHLSNPNRSRWTRFLRDALLEEIQHSANAVMEVARHDRLAVGEAAALFPSLLQP